MTRRKAEEAGNVRSVLEAHAGSQVADAVVLVAEGIDHEPLFLGT